MRASDIRLLHGFRRLCCPVDYPADIVIFNPSRDSLGTVIDMTTQMVSFRIGVGPNFFSEFIVIRY